jgi:multidrug resistance efflux pump
VSGLSTTIPEFQYLDYDGDTARDLMFSRFARAQDASSRTVLSATIGGGLLLVWTLWFFLARVSLYETSRQARLEVEAAPHDVDTPVEGLLEKTNLVLDRQVKVNEVLLEIDDKLLLLEKQLLESKILAIGPQLDALEREMHSDQKALRGEERSLWASVSEALARQRASEAEAKLKASEKAQSDALLKQQVIAVAEHLRSLAALKVRTAESEAAQARVGLLGTEGVVRRSDRLAKIFRIEAEIARFESERKAAELHIRILEQRIDQYTIRAPISGRIGHMANLQPGTFVKSGTRLCTIVPSGGLRAVAFFDVATAAGRVKPEQPARIRLSGFPWTKFGVLAAHVERVGTEPKEGLIRVELKLESNQKTSIPIEHGLQGSAEVEVEKVTPMALVLDAAGRYLMNSSSGSVSKISAPAKGP